MNSIDSPDNISIWIERDDDGNITDWEMTLKRTDLIKILSDIINELKQTGKQTLVEQYEKLLQPLLEQEKLNRKSNRKKK